MLQIYNSLTKKKEVFKPFNERNIWMYVCGMTVYDFCHIGHARTVTAFDVISRYLRAKGHNLTYVRNITDIDDKIIRRAADNDESITVLTDRMIAAMEQDFLRLGNLKPDLEPRATDYVTDMIEMIDDLIAKGFAYAPGNGDVYYRVRKFKNYGRLSRKILKELEAEAMVQIRVNDPKEDPIDFVLWKGAKAGEPSWVSPWGNGRPGWHIECSVMSKCCCLNKTVDIHGGGSDLKFPHHENEIAQSEATNDQTFVSIWMHSGAIHIDNVKMSKSLDNFLTVREILNKYDNEVVRYFLISSHYRSPVNYSEESLKEASVRLERLYTALKGLDLFGVKASVSSSFADKFTAAMDDDFNTAAALAALFELVRTLNKIRAENDQEKLFRWQHYL